MAVVEVSDRENCGFSPIESFLLYKSEVLQNQAVREIFEKHASQIRHMMYAPSEALTPSAVNVDDEHWCSIADIVYGSRNTSLADRIFSHLGKINPCPNTAERKIVIRDIICMQNHYSIGWCHNKDGNVRPSFLNDSSKGIGPTTEDGTACLFYDERYLVVVDNGNESEIIVTIKKL